ncbi:unnamed protein product, partial [Ectocarpus sp. 13 AM-2016]
LHSAAHGTFKQLPCSSARARVLIYTTHDTLLLYPLFSAPTTHDKMTLTVGYPCNGTCGPRCRMGRRIHVPFSYGESEVKERGGG